jgi:hypothetical protein
MQRHWLTLVTSSLVFGAVAGCVSTDTTDLTDVTTAEVSKGSP